MQNKNQSIGQVTQEKDDFRFSPYIKKMFTSLKIKGPKRNQALILFALIVKEIHLAYVMQ